MSVCARVYVCAHVFARVRIGWGKIEGGGEGGREASVI